MRYLWKAFSEVGDIKGTLSFMTDLKYFCLRKLWKILYKDFKEPVIDALSDVKRDREIYFKDLSLESKECKRLLSNARRRMSSFR